MIFFKIAFRNVIKNWRHSLSALLSLSASFVSLVVFDGYIDDIKKMYDDSFRHRQMLGDLIIEKPMIHQKQGLLEPWKFWFNEAEQEKIDVFLKSHPDLVQERVRSLNLQGLISNGSQSAIFIGRGFDLDSGERMRGSGWRWNAKLGLPLTSDSKDFSVMLGQGLSRKLGCSWEVKETLIEKNGGYKALERPFKCISKDLQISTMTADAQINAVDVQVLGLMDGGYKDIDDRFIQTSLVTAQTLMNTKDVAFYTVELKDRSFLATFIQKFNNEVQPQIKEATAMSWIDHPAGETFLKTMNLMAIFRNFVVVVILIISTLSVFNTLIKIIKERTKEIGTLRSVGFTALQIQKIFFLETLFLSFMGISIGLVAALIVTFILNSFKILYKAGILSDPVLFGINIYIPSYISAFLILLIVSLFACFISIRSSLSQKVIDNINHA